MRLIQYPDAHGRDRSVIAGQRPSFSFRSGLGTDHYPAPHVELIMWRRTISLPTARAGSALVDYWPEEKG